MTDGTRNLELRTSVMFRRAREAFGPGSDVAELLARIERCDDLGCPRLLLAAAIHAFVSADLAARRDAVLRYFRSAAHPPGEVLLPGERAGLLELEARTYGGPGPVGTDRRRD
ncbi:MAG TPA: hypothetical protein VF796_24685 [Humisphaera sp.]